MLLVDDGVTAGHLTIADIFFLVAAILAVIAGIVAYPTKTLWGTLVAFAVAAVGFGLFLL